MREYHVILEHTKNRDCLTRYIVICMNETFAEIAAENAMPGFRAIAVIDKGVANYAVHEKK